MTCQIPSPNDILTTNLAINRPTLKMEVAFSSEHQYPPARLHAEHHNLMIINKQILYSNLKVLVQ